MLKHMIPESDCEMRICGLHSRRVVLVKLEKDNPMLPGFSIVVLHEAIGPDIPVQDVHVGLRVELFDVEGILHGILAADAGAVGIFFIPGSHTLDHDHITKIIGPLIFKALAQFNLGRHPVIFAISELLWHILIGTGGEDNHTMVNLPLVHARAHHDLCGEISFEPAKAHNE
jgi:hypothetical protein